MRLTHSHYYLQIIQAKAFAIWKLGDYEQALEVFTEMEEALGNSPDRFKLFDNMALTYATIGEHEKAIEYYEKAREGIEQDNLGSNYLGVGFVQHAQKNYTASIRSFSQAIFLFEKGTDGIKQFHFFFL